MRLDLTEYVPKVPRARHCARRDADSVWGVAVSDTDGRRMHEAATRNFQRCPRGRISSESSSRVPSRPAQLETAQLP